MLELLPSSDNVIQQIPNFSLKKIFFKLAAVLNLSFKNEFVVVKGKLYNIEDTLASPPDPHSPTGSNTCLRGRNRTSFVYESSI